MSISPESRPSRRSRKTSDCSDMRDLSTYLREGSGASPKAGAGSGRPCPSERRFLTLECACDECAPDLVPVQSQSVCVRAPTLRRYRSRSFTLAGVFGLQREVNGYVPSTSLNLAGVGLDRNVGPDVLGGQGLACERLDGPDATLPGVGTSTRQDPGPAPVEKRTGALSDGGAGGARTVNAHGGRVGRAGRSRRSSPSTRSEPPTRRPSGSLSAIPSRHRRRLPESREGHFRRLTLRP